MRILSITGNRPQFIKAAPLHAALAGRVELVSLDTGQHYDRELAAIFYEELGLAEPEIRLHVGSGTPRRADGARSSSASSARSTSGGRTASWSTATRTRRWPAALAAAKEQVPIAHVEAGLAASTAACPRRSTASSPTRFALLLCPSQTAVDNLAREGITEGVHVVGDVMVDVARARSRPRPPRAPP